jgi:hypothetical protein
MRGLFLAGVVAAALSAPAFAGERQYVCQGQASSAHGEKVDVSIHLTPKGERVESYASWDPPRTVGPGSVMAVAPELSYTIMYNDAGTRGIGLAGDGLIMVMAFVPHGKRSSGNADHMMTGLAVEASIDDTAPVTLSLAANPLIADLPMTAFRGADLPALPGSARQVTLRLVDRKLKQVVLVRYDVSDSTSRDRLFATAWQAAEVATKHPVGCELTAEGD